MFLISTACGQDVATPPTPIPPPTPAAAPISRDASTPGPLPGAAQEYDPNETMSGLFSGTNHSGQETMRALERARAHKDISQVPVIIELMQFVGSSVLLQESIATLQELTGQRFDATNAGWTSWRVWLGEHVAEFQPPPDYLRWKVNVLSLIHPRFEEFLLPHGETARINLTEIVWGGVVPDGIPDLQNPETLSPDEADYLFPEDRVFGVSINGEHRAYPLRILNPHEMANDVLGGEPIALAY